MDEDIEIYCLKKILVKIKYLVIDVDGTMTDSGLYYDEYGNEIKKFSVKDAAGFFVARACGIKIIILTGKRCQATKRRAKELQADLLEQGIVDKAAYMQRYMIDNNIFKDEIGYIGDDLNDYNCMKISGWTGCPKDSDEEIIKIADYVSSKKGGEGAVRDIIFYLIKQRGQWEDAVRKCYGVDIQR